MNNQTIIAGFALLTGLAGLIFIEQVDDSKWRGPAGVMDSHFSRMFSRMLSDQGDDAYHGGAKHDVKFRPVTPLGRFVQALTAARSEEGSEGRQKYDTRAQLAYSRAVEKWLRFAFLIDPSNFNAFFIYYNYLVEDYASVEVSGADNVGVDEIQSVIDRSSSGRLGLREDLKLAREATKKYLQSSSLRNPLECYNAAVGVWMLFEVRTSLGEISNREEGLAEVRRKMHALMTLGDSLELGRGHPDDTSQSRQYAQAILTRVGEIFNSR
jgi:hypothetical protein